MPDAAVTIAGWLSVSAGSTTASVGRSARVADPGLHLQRQHVEHADRGALRAGAGRGRDRDQRQQRLGRRQRLPDRRVDVVHQLAGVGGQQVDRLRGVDRRAAADGQDRVERARRRGRTRWPPRATRRSARRARRRTSSPRCPRAATCSAIRAGCPVAATPGSVTSSTRRAPYDARSWPTSAGRAGAELERRSGVGEDGLAHSANITAGSARTIRAVKRGASIALCALDRAGGSHRAAVRRGVVCPDA